MKKKKRKSAMQRAMHFLFDYGPTQKCNFKMLAQEVMDETKVSFKTAYEACTKTFGKRWIEASKTRVLFRWDNEYECAVALMPYEISVAELGYVSYYSHVGQHSHADIASVMSTTRPATEEEYKSLKEEMEGVPYEYDFKIIKKVDYNLYRDKLRALRQAERHLETLKEATSGM